MRVYRIVLAPTEKRFKDNAELPPLKQEYDEFLQERILVSERELIRLLGTGRVRQAVYQGVINDLKEDDL